MKIAYIDLNPNSPEDYSINPKRYGGGRIFAAHAKEYINSLKGYEFDIFATQEAFSSFGKNDCSKAIRELGTFEIDLLRSGEDVDASIAYIDMYDIILHHYPSIYLNTKVRQVVWPVGFAEPIDKRHKHILSFAPKYQNLQTHEGQKIYKTVIGPPAPAFQKYEKEDFIFVCGLIRQSINSIPLADYCKRNKLNVIFAGPIDHNYSFLDYVDNDYVKYLGEITEEEKVDYLKKALCCAQLHSNPTCATLAGKEAQLYGCPLITTNIGEWSEYIKDNYNGFKITDLDQISEKVSFWKRKVTPITQEQCYLSALPHSADNMVKSYLNALNQIVNEK